MQIVGRSQSKMFLRLQTVLGCFLASLAVKLEVAQGQNFSPNLLAETLAGVESSMLENEHFLACKKRRPDFDLNKMAKELKDCYERPASKFIHLMSSGHFGSGHEMENLFSNQDSSNRPTSQQVALVQRWVKTGCELGQNFWQCAKPILEYSRKECGFNRDLEFKYVRYVDVYLGAFCKNGGHRLIDFYITGGGGCVEHYKTFNGAGCNMYGIKRNTEFIKTTIVEDLSNKQLLPSFCELTTDVQTCLSKIVDICPLKEPTAALKSILEDVQRGWSKDYCLHGGGEAVSAAAARIGLNFSINVAMATATATACMMLALKFSVF